MVQLNSGAPPQELAPGLFGLRLKLPFILNHVQVWLLEDAGFWTVIDTGLGDLATRSIWEDLLGGFLAARPIGRLIVTHCHPDHVGLAGWIVERTGTDFLMTRTEWISARMLCHDNSEGFIEAGRRYDQKAGLDPALIEERAARGNLYRQRTPPPPSSYRRLQQGDRIQIGGDEWQVMIGEGHSPEMACLFSPARNLFLAADQILPKITPNVSVWPTEPEGDPLGAFLASLASFKATLPDDCLVLPSHGQPFCGAHARIDAMLGHHDDRLNRVLDLCRAPRTAFEILPALFDRTIDRQQIGFAIGEAVAHLNHLLARGAMFREPGADGAFRYQIR